MLKYLRNAPRYISKVGCVALEQQPEWFHPLADDSLADSNPCALNPCPDNDQLHLQLKAPLGNRLHNV